MQISDAGADVLLDALVMDRSMVLLDLSANQLTMKRCALSLLSVRDQGRLVKVCLQSLLFDVYVTECTLKWL